MRKVSCRLALALALALSAGPVAAQSTYPNVKLGGRLQVQFYGFDNAGNAVYQALPPTVRTPESSFLIRRARFELTANLAENIAVILQPNYTTGQAGVTMAAAYLDIALTRPKASAALTLRAGQFKRPFGRYELTSSNNLPSLERGAYRGLVPVASNNLAVGNGLASFDIGAGLYFTGLSGRLELSGAVMNGTLTPNVGDLNGAKSFYARATYALTPKLAIGASYGDHDYVQQPDSNVPADSSARNTGYGLDAQWSAPGTAGLYLMVDYLSGESTLNSANSIWGFQAVAAYNIRMISPSSFLHAIEPAFRYDIAEPDNSVIDDQSTLITAGVNLYLTAKAQVRLMYERQDFEEASLSPISGFRGGLTVNF